MKATEPRVSASGQRFTFRRYRGSYQLRISTPEDLDHILELDEARWAATSAPHEHLPSDPGFLVYVDKDQNQRLRVRELQGAYRWLKERMRDRSRLAARTDQVRLDDIDPAHPEGQKMRALGERLLRELNVPDRTLGLGQVREFKLSYSKRFPNGDGVVTAGQATPELASLVGTIVATTGGSAELSGDKGAGLADLDGFLERARALVAWKAEEAGEGDHPLRPAGDESDAAVALVEALAPKVEQFFAQWDLLRFDEAAAARLKTSADELARVDVRDPAAVRAWLAQEPLARPGAEPVLPLAGAEVNPCWADELSRLARLAPRLVPGLPSPAPAIDREQWKALRERLAPRTAWLARRPSGISCTPEEARAIVDGPLPERLRELLLQDQRASDELQQVQNLERLALYQRWLIEVANNFVSFPALFIPGQRAIFQAGRLVIDGRDLSFCLRVRDRAAHKAVAEKSGMFLAYATITRKEGDAVRTFEVVAAVTAGTRGAIEVGKRGVFYDRDGLEWDAQVVDLVVNPISLLEAAVSPFSRLKRLVGDRIQKLVASKLEGIEGGAGQAVQGTAPPPPAPAPGAPAGGANLQTLIIGGGAVFTGLTAALAFLLKTLSEVDVPAMFKALVLVVLAIMGLSALLGWFKLRARDLAIVLEACEWAVNVRMFLTRRHSLLFTRVPPLPRGSRTEYLIMPGEQEATRRRRLVFALIVVSLVGLVSAYWRWRVEVRTFWNEKVVPRLRSAEPPPEAPGPPK